jgi:hypothetical protein
MFGWGLDYHKLAWGFFAVGVLGVVVYFLVNTYMKKNRSRKI